MEIPPATLATLTVVCCVSHPEWAQVEEQKRLATHTHATPRPARKPRRFLVLAASECQYCSAHCWQSDHAHIARPCDRSLLKRGTTLT